ncbi:MAG: HAD family hydrolase [Planctomycetia bacterium]
MPHSAELETVTEGSAFPPPGVGVVVFDVVGTLIEPSPSVAVAYRTCGVRHGVELDVAEIQRRFSVAWSRQEAVDAAAVPAFATSPRRELDRWRGIVEDVFAGAAASEAIFADLWEHFGRVTSWRPLARGVALVQAAVDSGATVAVASNFDDRLLPLAAEMEPLVRVPHVFASSELGWRKPAPEFFRCLERRLGCLPHEAVLVGDDPELDLAAARRAGWAAIDVRRPAGPRDPDRSAGLTR